MSVPTAIRNDGMGRYRAAILGGALASTAAIADISGFMK
jgi:hypothetical protein